LNTFAIALQRANGRPVVNSKASVYEAARVMRETHSSAVLIVSDAGKLVGIFTTKDLVLRVIAADLAPETTNILRVMTKYPDTIKPSTSVAEALWVSCGCK
jgi:CBS domain-containing protein